MRIISILLLLVLLTACGRDGGIGEQGAPGVDLTSVYMVQLCPGTSNYGTFIEYGFCVSGKLYGTYSANGGFSTYLAPGRYNSNAINSTCSFTVAPNCVVIP